jgi:hypothetical protein
MNEPAQPDVPQFDALAALDVITRKLFGDPDPDAEIGDANHNDPPSPAADMLDALLRDSPTVYPGLEFSDIADTNPAGIGEAAITVHDPVTNARFLLVCLPLDQVETLLTSGPGPARWPDEEEPEPVEEYDPGPECDDEGGMSEYRYMLPDDQ